jgi:hypothetical protein
MTDCRQIKSEQSSACVFPAWCTPNHVSRKSITLKIACTLKIHTAKTYHSRNQAQCTQIRERQAKLTLCVPDTCGTSALDRMKGFASLAKMRGKFACIHVHRKALARKGSVQQACPQVVCVQQRGKCLLTSLQDSPHCGRSHLFQHYRMSVSLKKRCAMHGVHNRPKKLAPTHSACCNYYAACKRGNVVKKTH